MLKVVKIASCSCQLSQENSQQYEELKKAARQVEGFVYFQALTGVYSSAENGNQHKQSLRQALAALQVCSDDIDVHRLALTAAKRLGFELNDHI